jgi:GntR family transcriptional regulator, transcriptional repressor for pyruvate dehydrogenase complex
MQAPSRPAVAAVFEPVQTATTFEETVERLGTAIRLGLLPPGARLPPERELADQLGIARSTLRQALTALVQSGHLRALRGRSGGTFVAAAPPAAVVPTAELLAGWRDTCDRRLAVELGVAVRAAERATEDALAPLDDLVVVMDAALGDFPSTGRRTCAGTSGSPRRPATGPSSPRSPRRRGGCPT